MKGGEGVPGTLTEALGFLPSVGKKDLPLLYVAGVGDGVLILGHQVLILGNAHDGDSAFFHMMILFLLVIWGAAPQGFFCNMLFRASAAPNSTAITGQTIQVVSHRRGTKLRPR